MKIELDRVRCTGLGMCEALAPDYFEIADDGSLLVLADEAPESDRAELEEAVASCPTEALRLLLVPDGAPDGATDGGAGA